MIYCLPSPGYHFFYFLSSFDKRPTMPTHLDASGPRHVNNHHMTGKLCLPLLTSFLHFNLHHLKTHQPHDNMLLASWPSTWPLCFIIHRHPLHATHASGLHHAAFHHIHGSLVSLVLSLSSHFLLHFDILTPSQDTSTTQHATYILLLQCALHLAVHRRRLHATHASGLHYPASHHIAACVISLWLTDHSNTQPHATSMLPLQRALHLAVHRRLPHATQTSGLYYAAFHHIYGLLPYQPHNNMLLSSLPSTLSSTLPFIVAHQTSTSTSTTSTSTTSTSTTSTSTTSSTFTTSTSTSTTSTSTSTTSTSTHQHQHPQHQHPQHQHPQHQHPQHQHPQHQYPQHLGLDPWFSPSYFPQLFCWPSPRQGIYPIAMSVRPRRARDQPISHLPPTSVSTTPCPVRIPAQRVSGTPLPTPGRVENYASLCAGLE
ncbi:unnamed protein product [Penicillium salamii]|uniref:Uncharacterized protein n=1 Tax=Penicillium salamii TaxID=1612424 RepID=A0A9W4N5N3_9EURO|nr:unnamed protein product [Penicillium salamii]